MSMEWQFLRTSRRPSHSSLSLPSSTRGFLYDGVGEPMTPAKPHQKIEVPVYETTTRKPDMAKQRNTGKRTAQPARGRQASRNLQSILHQHSVHHLAANMVNMIHMAG